MTCPTFLTRVWPIRLGLVLGFVACSWIAVPIAAAAVFHLDDGSLVTAAFVAETPTHMHLLGSDGKPLVLERERVVYVDWKRGLDPKLEKKVAKARKKFFTERRKQARELLRSLGQEPSESQRLQVFEEFASFVPEVQLHALADGLKSGTAPVRSACFDRLAASEHPAATLPLVRLVIQSDDSELALRAHQAAAGVDTDTTRRLYEYVAAADEPEHQTKALQKLGLLGRRESVPFLVKYLTYVESNIRLQLSTLRRLREVPVSLGGGATNVPIELPETSLIEVGTSIRVPVETYEVLRLNAVGALEQITGERLGNEPGPWKAWWQSEQRRAQKEKAAPASDG